MNDEFAGIHMDEEVAKAAGFPRAIGMGNPVWTYFHNMLRDWMGPEARIEEISAQYQQPNLRDSTITVRGKVAQVIKVDDGTQVVIGLRVNDDQDRKLGTGEAKLKVKA